MDNKTYFLTEDQFYSLLTHSSQTHSFDTEGHYYTTGILSSELFDTYNTSKIFPLDSQVSLWDTITSVQVDWDTEDESDPTYIKNKPVIPTVFNYAVDDVEVNGVSVLDQGNAKISLVDYLQIEQLKTVNNISLLKNNEQSNLTITDITYLTEPPQAQHTKRYLKFVVLDSAPTQEYDGYIYIYPDEV